MPDFDGDNLIITLDSGVTEVDVINDIYEPWKDWMLASPLNRRYPQAFISDGGNPLTAIINQGSYIFLQNQYGWRIRPPEEDITIYLTGNLAVADTNLDAFVPTIGAFTAAILGLQPVTQGVSQELTDGVEFINYIGKQGVGVTINAVSGTDSSEYPYGTRRFPCKTEVNFDAIHVDKGILNAYVASNITLTGTHTSGHTWFGDNPQTINIDLDPGCSVPGSKFQDCFVTGQFTSSNIVWECIVGSITNANGFIYQSTLVGPIVMSDNVSIERCWVAPTAVNQTVTINFNSTTKSGLISSWNGGRILVKNMVTGSLFHMQGSGGKVTFDSTCTGGTARVYGGIEIDRSAATFDSFDDDSLFTRTDATQAKTDQLTFTQSNVVDSNIQYVNDIQVEGTGSAGDEWGPV